MLPRSLGLKKAAVKAAAALFADRSSARIGVPFRAVTVILQDDAFSAQTHAAINGAEGPTDVTTQAYAAMPPEPEGVYGELHGMDHLSGADDLEPADYERMRRRELAWLKEVEI